MGILDLFTKQKQSFASDLDISTLTIQQKDILLKKICSPKRLAIEDSQLMFYVHSTTEEARIRKFKEPWTIEWLRKLPSKAVLYDIGANIGITSLVPAEAKSTIQVVAVEPAPANFISLVKNIQLNNYENRIYALPIGLGHSTDVTGLKLTTFVPGGAMHSFGEIVVNKIGREHKAIGTHFCMRMKLDDLVKWPGLPFPTHIKVDIDGGETELLAGAHEVLADTRCCGVQIEVVDSDDTHARSQEVTKLMAKFGFSIVAYFDHNNTFPRCRDIQFLKVH